MICPYQAFDLKSCEIGEGFSLTGGAEMKKWLFLVAMALFLVLHVLPESANAAVKPHAFYLSPYAGGYAFEKDENFRNRPVYGLALGYNFSAHWSAEANLSFIDTRYVVEGGPDTEIELYTGRIDILYHFLPEGTVVPHFAFGGGAMRANVLHVYNEDHDDDAIAHYGFGLNIYLSEAVALRLDARHIFNFNDSDEGDSQTKSNFAYTGGFQFQFGGDEPPKPPADTDSDGVIDVFDRCPGTRLGVEVDGFGCPLDGDKDGVPDFRDECPDTLPCTPVDRNGCSNVAEESAPSTDSAAMLDSDMDGVVDGPDKCPNTPPGIPVNEYGCPRDLDGDGVFDFEDRCSDTPEGVVVDASGCPIPVEEKTLSLDVEFSPNGAAVSPEARNELEAAARFISIHPESRILIEGHTDSVGPADFNLRLSQKRAESVRQYLIDNFGISPGRIDAKGFGESNPIADNATQEGRRMNRRVVVTAVKE